MAALCAIYAVRVSAICPGAGSDGQCAGGKGTWKRTDVLDHGNREKGIWYRHDPSCHVPWCHGNRMDRIYRNLICSSCKLDAKP